jgi:hypothetical protein
MSLYVLNSVWLPSDETVVDIDLFMLYTTYGYIATSQTERMERNGETEIFYVVDNSLSSTWN